jgi:hypothetical protein
MSQTEMIQAGIQMEAARELGELVRPLIRRIIRGARSLRLTTNAPEAARSEVIPQSPANTPVERIQVRDG